MSWSAWNDKKDLRERDKNWQRIYKRRVRRSAIWVHFPEKIEIVPYQQPHRLYPANSERLFCVWALPDTKITKKAFDLPSPLKKHPAKAALEDVAAPALDKRANLYARIQVVNTICPPQL